MNRFRQSKEQGFTLLELMVSLTVLSIAFVGILPLFFYSQAQLKRATLTSIAMTLVQQKMERISELEFRLIHYQDDPFGDATTEYTYILPEYFTDPCRSLPAPNPCGWHGNATENKLMDIVIVDGYYFTRYIDIDHDDIPTSFSLDSESTGMSDSGLPDDRTKRVTVEVRWLEPGGKEKFIRSTTQVFDDTDLLYES